MYVPTQTELEISLHLKIKPTQLILIIIEFHRILGAMKPDTNPKEKIIPDKIPSKVIPDPNPKQNHPRPGPLIPCRKS